MASTVVSTSSFLISGIAKNIVLFILAASNLQLLIPIKDICLFSSGSKDISNFECNTFKQFVGLFSDKPNSSNTNKEIIELF